MTTAAATEQPDPMRGDSAVLHHVINDLNARAEMGKERYGHYLETFNGRDALMDAYQEALDLCMYLRQVILEREARAKEIERFNKLLADVFASKTE